MGITRLSPHHITTCASNYLKITVKFVESSQNRVIEICFDIVNVSALYEKTQGLMLQGEAKHQDFVIPKIKAKPPHPQAVVHNRRLQGGGCPMGDLSNKLQEKC